MALKEEDGTKSWWSVAARDWNMKLWEWGEAMGMAVHSLIKWLLFFFKWCGSHSHGDDRVCRKRGKR